MNQRFVMKLKLQRMIRLFLVLVLAPCFSAVTQTSFVETRWEVHNRGMLHETVYNTGEICQPFQTGKLTAEKVLNPMMEWPPYFRTVIDNKQYVGQNNGWAGGIYISANYKGSTGTRPDLTKNRLVALCGGVGGSNAEQCYGVWSFPISIQKMQNFPVLEDGSLNSAFNPNEAEEKIIAQWNTSAGISVKRTSRAFSYPDYDDFIIYEYEFENNGIFVDETTNRLVKKDTTLVDVTITFTYAISPSMFGYTRYNNDPLWSPHQRGQWTMSFWDPDYYLLYNQTSGGIDSSSISGWPEQNAQNFLDWSRTGNHGGGILSPQAAGFSVLYYDTEHLSYVDSLNGPNNQSPQYALIRNDLKSTLKGMDLDPTGKVRQPYQLFNSNAGMASSKIFQNVIDFAKRPSIFYAGGILLPPIWQGRNIPINKDDPFSANFPVKTITFGPYYLKQGDKINFTTAEIVGYGADTSKAVLGGFYSSSDPWHPGRFWNRPVVIKGQKVTDNYVRDFGLPDYVNSKTVFINDVAHKAFEAYLGRVLPKPRDNANWDKNNPPNWPEKNPSHGLYKVPIPIPAPKILTWNTDTNAVVIKWNRNVESFENMYSTYASGKLAKFNIYRADFKSGPWTLLASIPRGNVTNTGEYLYGDNERSFLIGESKYYAVTSVDNLGNESGKTNIVLHEKLIGPASKLGNIYVVPNPYNASLGSGFTGEGASTRLGIYGLPAKCTINFYSFAGQRLWTIEHDQQSNSHNFELITRNVQEIASGLYFFVVQTPEGEKFMGKFIVVK
ncbi:MAG: hypothetical protein V1799_14515 [bacterium]